MKRGEIWTVAGDGDYTGKPRPVVIIQDDRYVSTVSVTVAVFTSTVVDAEMLRLLIVPSPGNGLKSESYLMVDKITTVRRARLGRRVGRLDPTDMQRFERALIVFLGIAH